MGQVSSRRTPECFWVGEVQSYPARGLFFAPRSLRGVTGTPISLNKDVMWLQNHDVGQKSPSSQRQLTQIPATGCPDNVCHFHYPRAFCFYFIIFFAILMHLNQLPFRGREETVQEKGGGRWGKGQRRDQGDRHVRKIPGERKEICCSFL